jgi:YVTN family beta-propeller protein
VFRVLGWIGAVVIGLLVLAPGPAHASEVAPCHPEGADHLGYVSNLGDDTISVIDLESLKVVDLIKGFDYPFNQEITEDGSALYVDNSRIPDLLNNFTSRVDLCTHKVVRKYPSQGVPFSSMQVDGKRIYTTPSLGPQNVAGGPILEIDAQTGDVVRKIMGPLTPMHTTSYDGKVIWVSTLVPPAVQALDGKTLKPIGPPIPTCALPAVLRLSPDGKKMIALDTEDCIDVIDTTTHTVTHVSTFPQGNPAFGTFTPDGRQFWAGGYSGKVWVMDMATNAFVKSWDLHGFSVGVNFSRDGDKAFVSTTPPGTVIGPINQAFLGLAILDTWQPGGLIKVYDTKTYQPIKDITVGNIPMLISIPKGPFGSPAATPAKACASKRTVVLHLATRGKRIASASVLVDGRRVKVARVGRNGFKVVLSGAPNRKVSVIVRARLADGRRVSTTRRYRTCA